MAKKEGMFIELKTGDVVALPSGGPRMTVDEPCYEVGGRLMVRCIWFTDDALQEKWINRKVLALSPNGIIPALGEEK